MKRHINGMQRTALRAAADAEGVECPVFWYFHRAE